MLGRRVHNGNHWRLLSMAHLEARWRRSILSKKKIEKVRLRPSQGDLPFQILTAPEISQMSFKEDLSWIQVMCKNNRRRLKPLSKRQGTPVKWRRLQSLQGMMKSMFRTGHSLMSHQVLDRRETHHRRAFETGLARPLEKSNRG